MTEPALFPAPDGEEPIFTEPWQARAFALTVSLHERGVFTWREWADALAARIASAHAEGDPDLGDTYYHHWLGALEDLLEAKGIGSAVETARWRDAWQHAGRRTPHGKPIEIHPSDFATAR
jgi:nitrile hydratase accessory protein